MEWIRRNIKWIMLVSGALTSTMFFVAVAPHQALNMIFGEVVESPVSELIVRNWGVLVGGVGLMLIYGAFKTHVRKLVLVCATVSKLVFISLVLNLGGAYLAKAGVTLVLDAIFIVLFCAYLVTEKSEEVSA